MWTPESFERRPTTLQPSSGAAFHGTQLLIDGVEVSNAVELIDWSSDPLHLNVCAECLVELCHAGDWARMRRAGRCVVFLPVFSRWPARTGEEYEVQPPSFLIKGAMFLDRTQYGELRDMVPDLPKAQALKPLLGWEAVRLLRFEAPGGVLGDRLAPVQLQRNLLLATDSPRDTNQVARVLEDLLDAWAESWAPVVLKALHGPRWAVTLFLDHNCGALDWQPLAEGHEWARLLLAPGYYVDDAPRLADEDTVHTKSP